MAAIKLKQLTTKQVGMNKVCLDPKGISKLYHFTRHAFITAMCYLILSRNCGRASGALLCGKLSTTHNTQHCSTRPLASIHIHVVLDFIKQTDTLFILKHFLNRITNWTVSQAPGGMLFSLVLFGLV